MGGNSLDRLYRDGAFAIGRVLTETLVTLRHPFPDPIWNQGMDVFVFWGVRLFFCVAGLAGVTTALRRLMVHIFEDESDHLFNCQFEGVSQGHKFAETYGLVYPFQP